MSRDTYRLSQDLEAVVRRIVREEVAAAFGALVRAADHLDMPYETGELESSALSAIGKAAENTVTRLTCAHERVAPHYGELRCTRCGEPEPGMKNPFEEDGRG